MEIINSLIRELKSKPNKTFLLDGIGALISAVGLFLIGYFQNTFRVPQLTINSLTVIALLSFFYSLTVYFIKPKKSRIYLQIIGVLNLLYAIYTTYLIIQLAYIITPLALIYFILEILILAFIISIEFNVAQSNR